MIELIDGKVPYSYYDRGYFEGEKNAYAGQELDDDGGIESSSANWLVDRFNLKGKKVLDLACSKGLRVYLLLRRGVNAYGIDCSEYATSYWKEYKNRKCKKLVVENDTGRVLFPGEDSSGFNFHTEEVVICEDYTLMNGRLFCGKVEMLPFKENQFDLVTGFDLLEHLNIEQIHGCIKEAVRVSKNHIFFHFYIGKNKDVGISEDESDKSHISVYSMNWWVRKFEELIPKEFNFQAGPCGSIGWVWVFKNLDIDIGGGSYQRYAV